MASERRSCRCSHCRAPPLSVVSPPGIDVAIRTTRITDAARPSAGSVNFGHENARIRRFGGTREAPLRPLVERVGEGGVHDGALVAHEGGELGQVGQVGIDRAAGERVVERGQLAGEGLRRAHRGPFAAS